MFGKRKKNCYTFAAAVGKLGEIRSDEYFRMETFCKEGNRDFV